MHFFWGDFLLEQSPTGYGPVVAQGRQGLRVLGFRASALGLFGVLCVRVYINAWWVIFKNPYSSH